MRAYPKVFLKSLRRSRHERVSRRRRGKERGLGPALSHDIVVELHNGTLEAPTEPGEYTQFTNLSGHRRDLTLLAKLTAGRQIRATQVLEAAATCIHVFDLRP
jgi:hypothetical protein